MTTTLTARLSAAPEQGDPGQPLLAPQGPRVLLGGHDPMLSGGVKPSASALFGPRGACLVEPQGPLWVADTGHHRLLGWEKAPTRGDEPADWVLGQPDFSAEGRNAGQADASALTMNVPVGICTWEGRGLVVADSWNNRVLIWRERPCASGVAPDLVLGQADFIGQQPNRGAQGCAADTMHWPFQVMVHQGRLYVADTGNRRVLIWRQMPTRSGQPADLVLGQAHLEERSDNGGLEADDRSMRWPHDLALWRGNLVVTDAGNNRVMLWDGLPDQDYAPCAVILGQPDARGVDHNQGRYWPNASCVNMPYAVAATDQRVLVADTANSRLLGWRPQGEAMVTGSAAQELTGQRHFGTKGDNRWGLVERDSLCWPYGLQVLGSTVVVCDTGNHRVMLWELAEG